LNNCLAVRGTEGEIVSDPGFLRWPGDDSHDVGFVRWQDDDDPDPGFTHAPGFVPAPGGLLDGLPKPTGASSLHLLMEPQDIATIPGLPQHVYNTAATYGEQAAQDGGVAEGQRMAAVVIKSQAPPKGDVNNSDIDGEAALDRDIRNLQNEAVDRSVSAVKGQGESTTYTRADGRTCTLSGHIPNRDNNPLNIKYGDFAQGHGAIGRDGNFAIFGSPAGGFNAAMANFDRLTLEGSMPQYPISKKTVDFWTGTAPLNALVTMHSPPGAPGQKIENDTKGMIRDITRGAHLNPGDNWGDLTDAQKWDFVHSYGRREGFKGRW
jgi:hypothetical protein